MVPRQFFGTITEVKGRGKAKMKEIGDERSFAGSGNVRDVNLTILGLSDRPRGHQGVWLQVVE